MVALVLKRTGSCLLVYKRPNETLPMLRSVFEVELAEHMPVFKTSIAGIRSVGRMCAGTTILGELAGLAVVGCMYV